MVFACAHCDAELVSEGRQEVGRALESPPQQRFRVVKELELRCL